MIEDGMQGRFSVSPHWGIRILYDITHDWDTPADRAALLGALGLTEEALSAQLSEKYEEADRLRDDLLQAVQRWLLHAQTIAPLLEAQRFQDALPIRHTGNKWITEADGTEVISNLVYIMRCQHLPIYRKGTLYRHTATWSLGLNPRKDWRERLFSSGATIAGRWQKSCDSEEEAHKYLSQKKADFAYLFDELLPPIPKAQEILFRWKGLLPPCYRVEEKLIQHKPEPDE